MHLGVTFEMTVGNALEDIGGESLVIGGDTGGSLVEAGGESLVIAGNLVSRDSESVDVKKTG